MVAPLPGGVRRHFAPELRRFVLAAYHQGQTTVPLLRRIGISSSKPEPVRLLHDEPETFLNEARDVLRAGHIDYVVNEAALSYMREHDLSGPVITCLAERPAKQFADPQAGSASRAAWRHRIESDAGSFDAQWN